MRQVRQLLEGKNHNVYTITPEAPVLDAIKMMAEHRIGALLVMGGDTLAGVVSERDYARKVILRGRSSAQTAVADIMRADPPTVSPDTDVFDCMRLCTDSRVRHLPVLEHGKVVGIISTGDLVKAVIDAQAQQIAHLERYITG
ncbi:MAG: CBS domain-containing protein [Rhodanobacter sp.]|nr:MAG: CBS domain-containing protein [Rhodanobacter sp.]TAM08860.1 MAG: CBS domain-containing protein [Rhodanobacter sp.]TAM36902.1 MAG: CBS domain-containing protein [Rhodanobacter sp.]